MVEDGIASSSSSLAPPDAPGAWNLILCRHGESESNHAGTFTGLLDPPLTAHGAEEAINVGRWLKTVPITVDIAYTSPLQRASVSAQHILAELDQQPPFIVTPALNERDYGDLNGKNKAEIARKYGEELTNAWRRSYDAVPPGGESLKMTCDRVWIYFQKEIKPRLIAGERVLIVSHGNTLRGVVKLLEGLSKEEVRVLVLGTAWTRLYQVHYREEGLEIIDKLDYVDNDETYH